MFLARGGVCDTSASEIISRIYSQRDLAQTRTPGYGWIATRKGKNGNLAPSRDMPWSLQGFLVLLITVTTFIKYKTWEHFFLTSVTPRQAWGTVGRHITRGIIFPRNQVPVTPVFVTQMERSRRAMPTSSRRCAHARLWATETLGPAHRTPGTHTSQTLQAARGSIRLKQS